MNYYYLKLLRKFKINKLFYYILFFCENNNRSTINDSLELLNKIHVDSNTSCILHNNLNNSKKYDLDIIVPCYNVERYVEKCIESIINQKTKYSFRIIIINDGSNDNTLEIIKKYKINNNVLIIDQKNQGISGARNIGLRHSASKYLMFVDSDDFLSDDSIELMMNEISKRNDMVVCGSYNYVDINDNIIKTSTISKKRLEINDIPGFPWGKIYNSDIFKNIVFPVGYLFEDSIFNQVIAFQYSTKLCGINHVVYNYRKNKNGITHKSLSSKKSLDSLYITLRLYKDRISLGIKNDENYYESILNMVYLTYWRTISFSKYERELIFNAWCDFINEELIEFSTNNKKYKKLESFIRSNNFHKYDIYLKYYL